MSGSGERRCIHVGVRWHRNTPADVMRRTVMRFRLGPDTVNGIRYGEVTTEELSLLQQTAAMDYFSVILPVEPRKAPYIRQKSGLQST